MECNEAPLEISLIDSRLNAISRTPRQRLAVSVSEECLALPVADLRTVLAELPVFQKPFASFPVLIACDNFFETDRIIHIGVKSLPTGAERQYLASTEVIAVISEAR